MNNYPACFFCFAMHGRDLARLLEKRFANRLEIIRGGSVAVEAVFI